MTSRMPLAHTSSQFDAELHHAHDMVQQLGSLAQSQLERAVYSLTHFSHDVAMDVVAEEARVDALELQIDHDLVSIMARRQPTAGDLRQLVGFSKATTNLERVGDEAASIARTVTAFIARGAGEILPSSEIATGAELANQRLGKALAALASLDAEAARLVQRDGDALERTFDGLVRKLITYMVADPRRITHSLELMAMAKGIERVSGHARNIAELVIYIAEGEYVRYAGGR